MHTLRMYSLGKRPDEETLLSPGVIHVRFFVSFDSFVFRHLIVYVREVADDAKNVNKGGGK